MMEPITETIAAIATPPGRGGVGVIRISGPKVPEIMKEMFGDSLSPRQALLKSFYSATNELIDEGLAIYFNAPHSFTGEEVLELQTHGSPVMMDMLLNTLVQYGARLANAGEFTQRAFLNNKIDLAQAEAIADLIDAQTSQAALSASRSLQGEFSTRIKLLANQMLNLRMFVEAAIDFPEEEIDFLSEGNIANKIEEIADQINELKNRAIQGSVLKEGVQLAIVGRPNAGKSSILNALTQQETAIVTPIPGTTRDLIKETIQIKGIVFHLVDTAGIRDDAQIVEKEGILRAKAQQGLADKILLVVDASQDQPFSEIETEILHTHGEKVIVVMNKIDKIHLAPGIRDDKVYLSAKTKEGVSDLQELLTRKMGGFTQENSIFLARRRHVDALARTHQYIQTAIVQAKEKAPECVAQELRQAHQCLGEIVGLTTTEDLLGQIFSEFCIGK